MPPWFTQSFNESEIGVAVLAARLVAAFLMGCMTALIYWVTTGRERLAPSRPFLATLVLLSVVISLVTVVIGDSQARAFSLVGALAIVRFRTVVEDTRDTAFVIFTVVVGMGAGTGQVVGVLLGMPIVLLTGLWFRGKREAPEVTTSITLRMAVGRGLEEAVPVVLRRYTPTYRLTNLGTARGGSAIDVTYSLAALGAEQAHKLIAELTATEGVQSVEFREK